MAIKVSGTEVISDDKRILNNESLPDIRPSLLLDFANSKTLDPRITFTRGSTATYYDGKTTAKAEENLVTYSQDMTRSPWAGSGTTRTANTTTAPDGTTTANTIEITTEGPYRNVAQSPVGLASTAYTASVYLKKSNWDYVRVNMQSRTSGNGYIDTISSRTINLSDGTKVGSDIGTATTTDVGNGWYRVTFSGTSAGTAQTIFVDASFADSTGNGAPATNIASGSEFYVWGFQLEQRSSATAYTATTSSPIVKYQPVLQTAASGEARFDHDPVTGESKGLLIEEARTNLVVDSEDFTSVTWDKIRSTISSNVSVAPDGTTTADKLVANTDNNNHRADFQSTKSATTTYTLSVFAKAGEYTGVSLSPDQTSNTSDDSAYFDLSAGTVTEGVNLDASSITDVGNGWFLCSATFTTGASPADRALIGVMEDGSTTSYTGDGYSGVFLWGAQLEEGSFPTSYIPTSGSTVTRAAENAYMTGTNFSSWYSEGAYSFYCDAQPYSGSMTEDGQFRRLLSFSDGSTSNTVQLVGVGNADVLRLERIYAGTFTSLTSPAMPSGSFDYAATVTSGDQQTYIGGNESGNNTADGAFPSVSKLNIGSNGANGNVMCGTIKKLAYYPKRLPNATLQAMTEA